VRLTVWPADAADSSTRKTISLLRDEIKLEDQAAKARIIELPDTNGKLTRVGVIDLPSFYAPTDNPALREKTDTHYTSEDVAKLLRKLMREKVGGVVLDLRRNGGGSLEEAVRLTGLFIRRGTVVQVRDPSGVVMTDEDEDPETLYDGPLVVLTSRFSASASEIVAGALQDYGRALVVGDSTTHGKGTVQSLTSLRNFLRGDFGQTNDPGQLKVTIRKFYRPSGSSTQLKGVTPDIVLPSVNNVAEVGETAQENAMAWDTIQPARFDALNRVAPYVQELRRRSDARVAKEKDFAYVREDVELFKQLLADKSVSLNEAQRLKEKQDNEARVKARKKELAARTKTPGNVYEISLKQADIPGLPDPVVKTNGMAKAATKLVKSAIGQPAAGDDDNLAFPDVNLDEAGRILLDYLSLLVKESVATSVRPAASQPLAAE
jgi:carboxyl-terminal processing protease